MNNHPYRSTWLTVVFAVLLVSVAGCRMVQPEPPSSPAEAEATAEALVDEAVAHYPLAWTAWEATFFGPPEAQITLMPDTRATVNYFFDRYAGFDGCNFFLGVYNANTDGELRMMTPARTYNVCAPHELSEQAAMVSSMLLNVTAYSLEGKQLAAYTAGRQRLITFNPATPVPMPGTEWELKFFWSADRKQYIPVALASQTTITLGEGGQASGTGGCNSFTTSYEGDLQVEKVMEATATYAELPTLRFGPISSQMAACGEPKGIMDQEQAFFIQLGSVAYYFKLGGMMFMVDGKGTPLLAFGARS